MASRWRDETADDLLALLTACPAFTGVAPPRLERLVHEAEVACLPGR